MQFLNSIDSFKLFIDTWKYRIILILIWFLFSRILKSDLRLKNILKFNMKNFFGILKTSIIHGHNFLIMYFFFFNFKFKTNLLKTQKMTNSFILNNSLNFIFYHIDLKI